MKNFTRFNFQVAVNLDVITMFELNDLYPGEVQ